MIAREWGRHPEQITAPERAAWARHFVRYPPLLVVLGQLLRALMRFSGVKPAVVEKAVPYADLRGLMTLQGKEAAAADPDPVIDLVLKVGE